MPIRCWAANCCVYHSGGGCEGEDGDGDDGTLDNGDDDADKGDDDTENDVDDNAFNTFKVLPLLRLVEFRLVILSLLWLWLLLLLLLLLWLLWFVLLLLLWCSISSCVVGSDSTDGTDDSLVHRWARTTSIVNDGMRPNAGRPFTLVRLSINVLPAVAVDTTVDDDIITIDDTVDDNDEKDVDGNNEMFVWRYAHDEPLRQPLGRIKNLHSIIDGGGIDDDDDDDATLVPFNEVVSVLPVSVIIGGGKGAVTVVISDTALSATWRDDDDRWLESFVDDEDDDDDDGKGADDGRVPVGNGAMFVFDCNGCNGATECHPLLVAELLLLLVVVAATTTAADAVRPVRPKWCNDGHRDSRLHQPYVAKYVQWRVGHRRRGWWPIIPQLEHFQSRGTTCDITHDGSLLQPVSHNHPRQYSFVDDDNGAVIVVPVPIVVWWLIWLVCTPLIISLLSVGWRNRWRCCNDVSRHWPPYRQSILLPTLFRFVPLPLLLWFDDNCDVVVVMAPMATVVVMDDDVVVTDANCEQVIVVVVVDDWRCWYIAFACCGDVVVDRGGDCCGVATSITKGGHGRICSGEIGVDAADGPDRLPTPFVVANDEDEDDEDDAAALGVAGIAYGGNGRANGECGVNNARDDGVGKIIPLVVPLTLLLLSFGNDKRRIRSYVWQSLSILVSLLLCTAPYIMTHPYSGMMNETLCMGYAQDGDIPQ
jgi:hypothetical protein